MKVSNAFFIFQSLVVLYYFTPCLAQRRYVNAASVDSLKSIDQELQKKKNKKKKMALYSIGSIVALATAIAGGVGLGMYINEKKKKSENVQEIEKSENKTTEEQDTLLNKSEDANIEIKGDSEEIITKVSVQPSYAGLGTQNFSNRDLSSIGNVSDNTNNGPGLKSGDFPDSIFRQNLDDNEYRPLMLEDALDDSPLSDPVQSGPSNSMNSGSGDSSLNLFYDSRRDIGIYGQDRLFKTLDSDIEPLIIPTKYPTVGNKDASPSGVGSSSNFSDGPSTSSYSRYNDYSQGIGSSTRHYSSSSSGSRGYGLGSHSDMGYAGGVPISGLRALNR
ncbi:hypothetical protein AK88_03710 [Plasmodium fragile]|uniref:Early transcribed membrane protein n=1 Tax=Plasmodium fragile TaxID=5857 RepID=A0A0D9QID5_PLAFR|nr:uncharacterized protein AK88_03710 [Plasmodium fragile]XP_012336787.1 uncharacterized protein AK88_03754 [Plasmodium fragile]KJP86558.1 hypothetical protein AK88_03754 [Plasmodium fragile]KJP86703.1 hypothetical protein AK88_03710 [Plasmodium fragile]